MSDKWNGRDAALAAVVFATLSLLGQHTWGTVDAIQRFAVTRSLVERGSAVTPEFGPVKYAPLQSVLMIPTYLLGKGLGVLAGSDPRQVGYRVTAFLFTPLLVTLLCVIFRRAAVRAGASKGAALFGVFTLLFTTLLLPYSRLLFTEPLNALLVLVAASSALLVLNGALFAPLAIAQIAFGAEIVRRGRLGPLAPVAAFYAAAFAGYLVFYAAWDSFEGGWCWGPRFLLPFVAVLHLAIPVLATGASGWSRAGRLTFALPFAVGFAVNAAEDLGTWKDWEKATFGSGAVDYRRSVFEPRYAALPHSVEAGRAAARLPLFLAIAGASALAFSRLESRREAGT